jgi:flagellar biosynthesis protein FliQ
MIELANKALVLSFYLAGIPLGVMTVVSFIVSVLQAATQIQDQTLSIVPKIFSMVIILYLFAPGIEEELSGLFLEVLKKISISRV